MSAYTWKRWLNESQSLSREAAEWDEVWRIFGYYEPDDGSSLALEDLLGDRPDLRPGQAHPTRPNCYVETATPARLGTSDGWELTVHYKSEVRPLDVSPLDMPADISLETETVEVPTFKRADGTPILNTAKGLIYGVTRPVNRLCFQVEKNVAAIPAWVLVYSDFAVNSDELTIEDCTFAPKYVQLQKVRASKIESAQVNGATVYYRVLSFSLVYDPRGWDQKVYNRGLYEIDDTGKYVRILDDNKEPVDEPQFLDNAGKKLTTPINPDDVIEVDASQIVALPFSTLPLT